MTVKYEMEGPKLVGKMVQVEDGLLKTVGDFVLDFCATRFCYPEVILTGFPGLDRVQRCQMCLGNGEPL